jgi:hypothetical protein
MRLLEGIGPTITSLKSSVIFLRLPVSEDGNEEKNEKKSSLHQMHQTAATVLIWSTVKVGGEFGQSFWLPTSRTDFVSSRERHYELEDVLNWRAKGAPVSFLIGDAF